MNENLATPARLELLADGVQPCAHLYAWWAEQAAGRVLTDAYFTMKELDCHNGGCVETDPVSRLVAEAEAANQADMAEAMTALGFDPDDVGQVARLLGRDTDPRQSE